MELTKFNSCGFGFNTLDEKERNFVLKDKENESKILASFIDGVLEIFDNSVWGCFNDYEENGKNADYILRSCYVNPTANVVMTDLQENGDFNYLCVECDYIDAKIILQNFLDCYGEMVVETI